MPRRSTALRWCITSLLAVLALFAAALLAASCLSFGADPREVSAAFAASAYQPTFRSLPHGAYAVHWVEVGEPELPPVLFVHGSPGSWDAFLGLLTEPRLLSRARLLSLDRPGFGRTAAGDAEGSLLAQAAAVEAVADEAGGRATLVGHSLGGPIVALVAAARPELVAGLVLVAPSLDGRLEPRFWYQRLAEWGPIPRLLPRDLVTSNEELRDLAAELDAVADRWAAVDCPVIVVQGERDRLVDPGNADYAEAVFDPDLLEVRRVSDAGHLIPWRRPELVVEAVLDALDRAARRADGSRAPRR